jgi:hypothetical protein
MPALKNLLISLAVALSACATAFGVFYALNEDAPLHRAARDNDAMAWLRTEFQLDAAQFAAIQKLHDDYGSVCAEHCAIITEARQRSAPAAELARLEQNCVDAMTDHFRRVAAVMSPAQGQRYLATVLPRIAGYPHAGAPDVQGRQP